MGLDVQIKQRVFGNKTMPLEVILGNILHYGSYDNYQLMIGELGETEFMMIERGFIVNLTHIDSVKGRTISLDNDEQLSISRGRYAEVRERLHMFWREQL